MSVEAVKKGRRMAGLVICVEQLQQMASHIEGKPVDSPKEASAICHSVVDQGPAELVLVSTYAWKTAYLLVLHQHGASKVVDHEMWNNSRLVTSVRRWLAQRGLLFRCGVARFCERR
jgi:hypothetical protein